MEAQPLCPKCLKAADLCVCEAVRPLPTRLHVLILQHPQEPDKDLGSARLANLSLPSSTLRVGLSWPNLKAALGREARPSRWAVLYLGSGVKADDPKARAPAGGPWLRFVDPKGSLLPQAPAPGDLDGIVILDGTWSQAKALWWRNPWLLKLRRAILSSPRSSLYRELRREPRRECLSTIESIADSLRALGEPPLVSEGLKEIFAQLLKRQRERLKVRRPS